MSAPTQTIQLHPEFKGEVIGPDDPGFDAARAVYNGGIDRRPAVIVRPTGAADVMDAVTYARTSGLPLVVRCGGHSVAGTSASEGGVLIDLSSLKGVHVDPRRGTAVAQAGVLWGEYDRETQLRGLATPGGRVTTTGVGGFALGGGYGWLSRKYGLTCDNLVSADIVTADGRFLRVSEDEHPDLLWGLRGAGANFGVVTAYELRLHEIPPLLMAGMLVVPNQDAEPLLRAYRDYTLTAPEEIVSATAVLLAPPADFVPPELVGTPVLAFLMAYVGDPGDAVEALAPMRDAVTGAGGMDLIQPMPYTTFQAMLDWSSPKGMLNYHRGQHLSSYSDEVLAPYLQVGRTIHSPLTQGVVFHHGGAVSRVAEDATAAGHRAAAYMAHPIAAWATPRRPTTSSTGCAASRLRSVRRQPAGPTSTSSPARQPPTSSPATARRSTPGSSGSRTSGTRRTSSGPTTTSLRARPRPSTRSGDAADATSRP